MGDFDPKKQVKIALSSRHILADIMSTVVTLSSKTQLQYVGVLEDLIGIFRSNLKDRIGTISLDHAKTWNDVRGKKFGFIDGGVASISSLGSEPIAIRVGRYSVIPGATGKERESFTFQSQLVDELFDMSDEALFDEFHEDFSKLRDMARICTEAGAVYQSVLGEEKFDYLFLHGPLVNPSAPYADFPAFTFKMLNHLGVDKDEIEKKVNGIPSEKDKSHFISTYRYILEEIYQSNTPVMGVIERSAGSRAVSMGLLEILSKEEEISKKQAQELIGIMKENRITDAILFACLLQAGEYIIPFLIDKNTLHKSPDKWKTVIKKYPRPLTTYLKATETSFPFRIEMHPAKEEPHKLISLAYHMTRLLPNYAFPVGLDIADKFAKVPKWMSNQISKEQSSNILQQALRSGSPEVINMVRLYLSGNTRDWLFRPNYDK